ncbi:MAG: choice-of-anchor D domain-containing protein [Myxococcales bacterium]
MLDIRPATVDFGDVALGKEATVEVNLQNVGIVPMSVAQLAQLDDAAFEVHGLPVTLGAGASASVTVRYRPPDLGSYRRDLQLTTDSPEIPRADLAILGHAVRGLATLSGDSFDFGDVVLNEVASQELSLSNNDGHALTEIRIELPVGGDASAFTVKPPGDLPLQPGQSMSVHIDFRPHRLGDFSAVVPVTPCPTCSARNVSLVGRGVTRLLNVQPATIDFGQVLLGSTATQPITVTNTSRSPLIMQSLDVSGAADMTVSLDGARYPMTLAPGQTLTGVARFAPRSLGDAAAQVAISASDGAPGALSMTGTGFGAVIQATPRSVFVGPTALGTSRSGQIVVTNVGLDPKRTSPLTVSNISVISDDRAWSLDTSTPIDVGEPGGQATIRFTFSPQRAGMSQATLAIGSNDGLNPVTRVPIAGTGRDLQPCTLSVSPGTTLDFGATRLFTPSVQGVELTNTTADDCIVGDPAIVSGGPAFRWPGGVVPAGRELPPGGRMSVRLEFVAQQATAYAGAIQFYVSNRNAPAMTIDLAGQGDDGCFFVSPATVDFGATTLGCGAQTQNAYAVNHCSYPVTITGVTISGQPFYSSPQLPVKVAPQSSAGIPVTYTPPSAGDDVGTIYLTTDTRAQPYQAGLTGGAQTAATVFDQWDQSTPKVDLLIVIDNSGSMAEEQHALAANLDHLWNRIALANADFHIATTSTGMDLYTSGWSQCPGGASGGEGGRFFPVDNSHPRLLTPQTPNVKQALFLNTDVGQCHWKEQFTEPVVAALTDPLISATKAPGTTWPNDGNAGFLRDDARLALMAVSDSDDDIDLANPPPVSYLIDTLRKVKHGALDLVSFAGIVPLQACSTSEAVGTRYTEIAHQLGGHVFDICQLNNMGAMLDSALGDLLQPLSSFPLSAHPKDPTAIDVTVNGARVTTWSYDATANRLVFPANAVPAPGSHITARYVPACR